MPHPVTRYILAFTPLAVSLLILLGGGTLLQRISARSGEVPALRAAAGQPLYRRLRYCPASVDAYWKALQPAGRVAERRFLELDLLFPFFYGAGFTAGLLYLWASLGRSFPPAWLVGLVALAMLADWTENLVQLQQLARYERLASSGLQSSSIALASAATLLKLVCCTASLLLLFILACAALRPRS